MKEFVKEHGGEMTIIASLMFITVLTVVLVTASGKAIVVELDGLNSSSQDNEGNYEERHVDGGRLKFYAE